MTLILVFIVFTILAYRLKVDGLSKRAILFAWLVKVIFGFLFLYVHTKIYGISGTDLDWIEYMQDSVTLNNVAFHDFGTYLKFLFGTNTFQESVHYLSHTNHWDMGDLSLLNDSRNVLKINSLIVFISKGDVNIHILFFAFISFIGLLEFFKAIQHHSSFSKKWIWLSLLFFPSLGFWTSSVLKEPLMITGLALLLHGTIGRLSFRARLWRILIGFVLMMAFKPYVFICFTLAFLVYVLARYILAKKSYWLLIPIGIVSCVFVSLNTTIQKDTVHRITRMQFDFMNIGRGGVHVYVDSFSYYFRTDQLDKVDITKDLKLTLKQDLVVKKLNTGMKYPFEDVQLKAGDGPFNVIYTGSSANSFIELTPINNNLAQLVLNIPEAFVNATFRPYPWDPGGKLKYISFIETICVVGFFIFMFIKNWGNRTNEEKALLWFLLSFAFAILILIGWTTPVLGALVRYRLPAYLSFLLAAFIGTRKKELRNG